jgi:predicted Zn finger-like uncharacterized protein
MQASCPQCSQRIAIDDSKVPDRPFAVKCPKCQAVVKLPGKGAAAPSEAPAPPAPTPVSQAEAPFQGGDALGPAEEARVQMYAQLRREIAAEKAAGSLGQALVALPDRGLAGSVALVLTRLGYAVETVDDWEQGARLLEQGVYTLVATARAANAQGRPETLYQRLGRLSPDARRRVFVMLIGDDLKTGDGTQGFVLLADLAVNTRDVGTIDAVLHATVAERSRLYQVFQDARRRYESSAS